MKKLIAGIFCALTLLGCKKGHDNRGCSTKNQSATTTAELSFACEDRGNCENEVCQEQMVAYHEINQQTFETITTGFSQMGKSISASTISSALVESGVTCATHVIAISGDMDDTNNNQDISFNVVADENNSGYTFFTVNYPIALFAGILAASPLSFEFFKAEKVNCSSDCNDIVFTVNFSGNVTKYYDISDVPPTK